MRLSNATGTPLSDEAAAEVDRWIGELAELNLAAAYSSDTEPDNMAARRISKKLGIRSSIVAGFREIDYGLWQSLLVGEIKKRYPKAYRQWRDAPEAACPPAGETFDDVGDRVWEALCKAVKRQRGRNLLLVVQPVAAGVLTSRLMGRGRPTWDDVEFEGGWCGYDLERISILENV